MAFREIECIWKDRKHFLGMPLSFTRYAISEDRLFTSIGFFNIHDDEILLYRIRDISTSRTLFQRMLGVGSITVTSSDTSQPTLVLKNIKKPMQVKELLHRQVEEIKERRRVRLNEQISGDCCHHDDDTDEDLMDADLD